MVEAGDVTAAPRSLPSLPTAPGRVPLLGHSVSLLRRPFDFLQGLNGLGDIVRIDIGTLPVYMLTRPELVRQVLVTQARSVRRGLVFERARPLFGEGLIVADGEAHLRRRRILQPALSQSGIGGYFEVMRRNTQAVAASWEDGQVVDVCRWPTI
ncbi:cytochrome P450 [Nonomuraea rhizosphaerae]|uniref:cytochrome P450 n=1 Tax=Nonomuraea rhizosphaerae TaxID=2665663 RepID=UPI001C5E4C42|nr:cytochrome P450 [Nonomuraea rhizosphaerae]